MEKSKLEENNSVPSIMETLKNSEFDIDKFKIQEKQDKIILIDEKNRKITVCYDSSKLKIYYNELDKSQEELKKDISNYLWDEYNHYAKKLNEIARLQRDKSGHIYFYRYKFDTSENAKRVHESKVYDEKNRLYDIYEYLKNEIEEMKNKINI